MSRCLAWIKFDLTRFVVFFSILFLTFSITVPKAAIAGEPALLSDPPLVSLTFDDGDESILSGGFPILNAKGIPGTLFVITTDLSPTFNPQLKNLENHGWEIGSHSVSHLHIDTLPVEDQIYELSQSKADLQAVGLSITGFAYPYGTGSSEPEVQARVAEYYAYGRSVTGGYNHPSTPHYKLLALAQEVSDSVDTMKGWVDEAIANSEWLIICMHTVDNSGDPYSISPASLTALTSYIKSKQDAGAIQAVTVRDGLALYGGTIPGPVISNVSSAPGSTQAVITWTTSSLSSTIVDYGLTPSFSNTTPETNTAPGVTSHSVTITGLKSCTTYSYRVRSRDGSSNEGHKIGQAFTTTGCDGIAPVISNVSAVPGDHQAEITWTTNEAATSRVRYGLTTAYGNLSPETDTVPRVTTHGVTIDDLSECTTYHYRVLSNDAGLAGSTSADATLTTGCDVTPPVISSVSAVPGDHQAEIAWTTNEDASSRVEYGLTASYGSSSLETDIDPGVTDHWVAINGLVPCTTYHYRVFSNDAALNEGGSTDRTLKTTGCDVTPPAISSVSAVPGDHQAEITWTTNEAASTRVEYGLTLAYGSSSGELNVSPRVSDHSAGNQRSCHMHHVPLPGILERCGAERRRERGRDL